MAKLDSEFNTQGDLNINSTLVLAGYFLAIMFVLNVAFGNAIMNVIAFGLPVNEMMIGFFLILLSITGHLKIPTGNATIFLYIWLALGLVFWLPFGFFEYGIIAGRDATQLLDCMVLFISYSLFSRAPSLKITQALTLVLVLGLTLEFLDRVFLFTFTGISVSSFVEVPLFGGTIGSSIIVVSSFWFGILMKDTIQPYIWKYLVFVSLILVLLLQNRFLYLSMIFTSLVYFYIYRPSFLNKRFLTRFFLIIGLVILFESFIGSLVTSVLNLIPDSEYLMSRRLFKYGLENFSLGGILAHLATGFGFENEIYSGAAGGVAQRLGWWYLIMVDLFSSSWNLFLGLGYGIPLTDSVNSYNPKSPAIGVIREPHNSFISVFARQGLILFGMWLAFHLFLALKSISVLKKTFKANQECKLLLVCLLVSTSTYICALVEPAFENPPIAISTYIVIGLSLAMLSRIKKTERSN